MFKKIIFIITFSLTAGSLFAMGDTDPQDLLIAAAQDNDIKNIKKAIELGANVNSHYGIALRIALKHKHFDIADALAQNGADINIGNGLILHELLSSKNTQAAQWLINHHCITQPIFNIMLHSTLLQEDFETAQWLVDHGTDVNSAYGLTLQHMFQKKKLKATQWLIDHGAHIEENDDQYSVATTSSITDFDVTSEVEKEQEKLEQAVDTTAKGGFFMNAWKKPAFIVGLAVAITGTIVAIKKYTQRPAAH